MGGRAGGGSGMGTGVRGDASMRHLSAAAQKALKAEESDIRTKGVEYGVVMDENGNVIWKGTDNSDHQVYIKGPAKDMIVTHNHPIQGRTPGRDRLDDGGSFSKQDIGYAVGSNVKEMRAVTGKYSFSLKRPAGGWNGGWKTNQQGFQRAKARVDRRIKKYYEATKKDWKTAGRRVQMTYWHLVNKEFAKAQGYTYTKTKIK